MVVPSRRMVSRPDRIGRSSRSEARPPHWQHRLRRRSPARFRRCPARRRAAPSAVRAARSPALRPLRANAVERGGKPRIVDGLEQVVERVRFESVDRKAVERRDEHDHRHAFLRHLREHSRPERPGIWMSRNMRSGAARRCGEASRPLAHWRTISMSAASRRRSSRPRLAGLRRRRSTCGSSCRLRRHFERQQDLDTQSRFGGAHGEFCRSA